MNAREELIRDLKPWAGSPRVPEKVQLLILEAIGALASPSEAVGEYICKCGLRVVPHRCPTDGDPHGF